MDQERIEFDVLTPEISEKICIKSCEAKCCDFVLSEHTPEIGIYDYYLLYTNNLQNFVTFYKGYGNPQLLHSPEGKCVFLDITTSKCLIYPIRPDACREYPYSLPARKVPDWCALYHGSTSQLIVSRKEYNKMIESKFSPDNVPEVVIMEYFEKVNAVTSLPHLSLVDLECLQSKDEFWQITFYTEYEMDKVADEILALKSRFTELPWYAVSLLYFDEKFDIKYQLQGIWLSTSNAQVKYLDRFPPNIEQLNTLLSLIESTKQLQPHLIAGSVTPQEGFKNLEFEDTVE